MLVRKADRKKYTGKKERKKDTGKKERNIPVRKKERKTYTGKKERKKEIYPNEMRARNHLSPHLSAHLVTYKES